MALGYSAFNHASFKEKILSDPIKLGTYCFEQDSKTYVHHSVFKDSYLADGSDGIRFAPSILLWRQQKRYLRTFVQKQMTQSGNFESIDPSIFPDNTGIRRYASGTAIRFDWFLFLLISVPNSKMLRNAARENVIAHWCGSYVPNPFSTNGAWANTTATTPPGSTELLDCPPPLPPPLPTPAETRGRGVQRQIIFPGNPSINCTFIQENEQVDRANQPPVTPLLPVPITPRRPIDIQLLDVLVPETPLLEVPITPACDYTTPLQPVQLQMVRLLHILF